MRFKRPRTTTSLVERERRAAKTTALNKEKKVLREFEIDVKLDPDDPTNRESWGEEVPQGMSASVARPTDESGAMADEDLVDGDEKITNSEEIQVRFSYPLRAPVTLTFQHSGGFLRKDVLEAIRDGYAAIYQAEADTAQDPGRAGPDSYNRGTSDGLYGIWGHDIGDLVIERVYQESENLFSLSIGS